MKFAIIDIGSNSVRLMLWANGKTLYKRLNTTRLGAGLLHSGVLSEESMLRSVQAVSDFCAEGRAAGAQVYAFATAAVRSAGNGSDFTNRVKEACGLTVDVVSGEDEALLGLYGALGSGDGGIIDIGGASTEVCLRQGGKVTFSVSLPLGAVKLYDCCHDDPALLEEATGEALPLLEGATGVHSLYAVGGTASTLACLKESLAEYDAARLQHLALSRDWVKETAKNLLNMPVEARKALVGMEAKRADIIAGGAYLLGRMMDKLSLGQVRFSDSDNLEGYLYYRGLI